MLGPISPLNAYAAPGLQPVVEVTREGIQATPPVESIQPAQPVQPTPANPGVTTGQQPPSGQQGARAQTAGTNAAAKNATQPQAPKTNTDNPQAKNAKTAGTNGQTKAGLTPQEQALIAELAQDDNRVRTHEEAHISAGGGLIRGGPDFEYETGPDSKRYAVGGEVSIDTTPVNNDPAATIRKAEHIIRAALAPTDPSAQDLRVAADAAHIETEAEAEERQATLDKQKSSSGTSTAKTQNISNPILDAMLRKAYGTGPGKTINSSSNTAVLGTISA